MTDPSSLLQTLRLLVFAATAAAGLRLWWQHRSRPAAYLAAAFGTLATAVLVSRVVPDTATGTLAAFARDLVIVGVAFFPWLFAVFAWSFERRSPRWLTVAGIAVAALSVWALLIPPLPAAGRRSPAESLFFATFITVWAALTLSTAARLWRAGGTQPLVRARMRLMAAGAFLVTVALLAAATTDAAESSPADVVIHLVAIASALLFLAGFAPPRPLRMWWRRRATAQWQHMQLGLIAAATPEEVAQAAVPVVSEVLGAGVAMVSDDGRVLAAAGLVDEELRTLADRGNSGSPARELEQWVAIASNWLVVKAGPYTPLFGQDEQDLLAGFALQLRLALERAQLFHSNDQARQQLEHSHDQTREMMVGLAHDLRSPMAAITGYVGLLRDTDDATERSQMLERIADNSEHLRELVDALVELSSIGRTQTDRHHVDLDGIVAKVIARLAGSYPHATIDAGELPTVLANPMAMEQIFENLLTNAAKHGGRDDITIRLTAQQSSDATIIDIVDNGRGIEPDEHETVFAPFRRGRHAAGRGSGVGLGLVRRIIDSHDGTITLLPTDTGAHFHIVLPAPHHPTDQAAEPV